MNYKRNGFSLLELMIVVGIGSIIAMGFATLFSDSAKQTQFIRQRIEVAQIEQQVLSTIGNATLCLNNLKLLGHLPPPTVPPIPVPVAKLLPFFDALGNPTPNDPPIVSNGEVTTTNMMLTVRLSELSSVGPGLLTGFFEVDFGSAAGQFIAPNGGPPILPYKIPLNLQVTGAGAVIACNSVTTPPSLQPAVPLDLDWPGGPGPIPANPAGAVLTDLVCPPGSVMSGIRVFTNGTCHHQCDPNGSIINSIQIYCIPVN